MNPKVQKIKKNQLRIILYGFRIALQLLGFMNY